MTTEPHNCCDPWTLDFDRDGTEDLAIIRDAHGNELVRSRYFWLPEGDDPTPPTLAAVRLMTAAPKLYRALEHLLEQTVDMDLQHDIELTEGEREARAVAQTAIAETTADLKTCRVTIVSRVLEVYEVRAENEEEAEGNLIEGRLCHTDDDLENEILSVEEVLP